MATPTDLSDRILDFGARIVTVEIQIKNQKAKSTN
jgi:hypothetical protein